MLAVSVVWRWNTEGVRTPVTLTIFFNHLNLMKMKKLNFEKFAAKQVSAKQINKIKGGDYTQTALSSGAQDWRDCENGTVTDANGNLVGQGPTGGCG